MRARVRACVRARVRACVFACLNPASAFALPCLSMLLLASPKFNDCEEVAVSELAAGINVSDAEIVRHLFPLVNIYWVPTICHVDILLFDNR